ncbi:hypothetical protein B0H17DRAFT_418929 [Mycena rosella]|uniref:Nephrocystin 3-like N-terminal domain-containing protein n=1 Tax=Mycena rosella TaxID=1033263 RepID=A0AAD7CL94_MYCRO|nr:hypothetical protein B0H17DRAFT_418929 [Mycena rosella]
MQTLCQRLREAGHLGGAFFFKRGHATRGNAKVLFATLAYQLALHPSRQLNAPISRSAETDPSVVGRGMDVQLYSLIVEPCKLLRDPAPLVLLIDGLDECEGLNVQQEILRLIASIAHNRSLRLRFLIASRPEAHIREEFEEDSFQELYDSVNVEQSFEDIRTYLRDEFTRIHHEHRHTMGNTLTPWPSPATLEALVIKSSGYFIYASTIIRFIDDKGFRPTKRLESIQKLSSDDSDSPFAALDQLYFQILSSAPDSSHSNLCDILCAVANFRLSSKDIDLLLGLDADDTELILRNLHSVLSMGSTLYPVITVHHASILDFLHDHKRSSTFYIDAHRRKLAHAVLKTLAYTYEDQQLNHQLNRAPDPLPWYARGTPLLNHFSLYGL